MKKFFGKHGEYLTIPVAILAWLFIPHVLFWIDPTAGSHDIGIFQSLLMGTVGLFFGTALVWFLMKIAVPDVRKELDDFLAKNRIELTVWQRGKFALLFYLGLLVAWVLLVMAYV